MRMKVHVLATGKTTATIILSQDQVDSIRGVPGNSRVPLAITYKSQVFRSSISIYRGQWMMVVNKEMRDGGLIPGHDYSVDLSVDRAERTVDVPEDFAAAMNKAKVRTAFDSLSYTHRKEHVRAIEDAKKPETRQRRIDAAITKLQS